MFVLNWMRQHAQADQRVLHTQFSMCCATMLCCCAALCCAVTYVDWLRNHHRGCVGVHRRGDRTNLDQTRLQQHGDARNSRADSSKLFGSYTELGCCAHSASQAACCATVLDALLLVQQHTRCKHLKPSTVTLARELYHSLLKTRSRKVAN